MFINYNTDREIKISLKRNGKKLEILKIIHKVEPGAVVDCYHIYPAFENLDYNFGKFYLTAKTIGFMMGKTLL